MTTRKSGQPNALHVWLERIEAKLGWSAMSPNGRARISLYTVNGQVFVVTEHLEPYGTGWDIFVQASKKNEIAATIDSAAAALGVEGHR